MAAMALAADTQVFRGRGDFGVSFFESTDASGCVITDVSVAAGTGTIHLVPGGPTTANGIFVFVGQFDTCRQLRLLRAQGFSSELSFQFANDPSSAYASGTLLVGDAVSGTSFAVSVDLSWTGFGASQRNAGSTHNVSPGGTVVVRMFDGLVRPAQASGIVSDGTTNFTPQPSLSAQLDSSSDTQVTVSVTH